MLAKVWLDHMFVMIHGNLVLTTISMVEDITGSQVGGTFYPCLREVPLVTYFWLLYLIFSAHLTRLIMNQELVMTDC